MNVRSFADLEDVLIESHTNNSYDEDLFEIDSSMREQHIKPEGRYDNDQKSPGGFDYADDFCESEEYLCPAIPQDDAVNVDFEEYERSYDSIDVRRCPPDKNSAILQDDAVNVNLEGLERSCDSIDDRKCSPDGNSLFEQSTTCGPSIIHDEDVIHPVADFKLSGADCMKECSTAQQNKQVVDISSAQLEIPKVITICQNPLVGNNIKNKSQFSSVKKASIEDARILDYLRRKNDALSMSGKEKGGIRGLKLEHDKHSPHKMVPKETNSVDARSAAVTRTAGRALHIPTTDHGMSKSTVKKIMSKPVECSVCGIPDYDPDYDCALEMMQNQNQWNPLGPSNKHGKPELFNSHNIGIMPHSQGPRFQFDLSRQKSDFAEDTVCYVRQEVITKPSTDESGRKFDQNVLDLPNFESDKIIESNRIGATTTIGIQNENKRIPPSMPVSVAHRGAADMVMDEIREGKITSNLLRLGVDRDMLSSKCEEIHCSFLSDLLGMFLTKQKRTGSSTLFVDIVHIALLIFI